MVAESQVPKLSAHYQLEVTRRGHMDELDVHVEAKPDVISEADRETAARELQHHIKALIGINTRIHIEAVGSVERSTGKAKRVVDKRPQ